MMATPKTDQYLVASPLTHQLRLDERPLAILAQLIPLPLRMTLTRARETRPNRGRTSLANDLVEIGRR
jgi:hypothetical protein